MKFEKPVKPMKGIEFWVGRLLLHFNWAKTFTWVEQNHNRTKQNTYYFGLWLVQRPTIKDRKVRPLSALCFVIGPLKVMAGIAN